MKRKLILLISIIGSVFFIQPSEAADIDCIKWNPGHYVYLTKKFRNIDPESFIAGLDSNFKGVQMLLYWKDIEIKKNQYNFIKIEKMLKTLKKYDKRLFLQLNERIFHSDARPIPDYLYEESEYSGGAVPFGNKQGSVAKIWNPNVLNRLKLLIEALGNRFDREPAFEGINFEETAINIDRTNAKNYSTSKYVDALKSQLQAAKKAFPHSVIIQYVNYLGRNKEDLIKFIHYCYETGVGIGGPDLVPDIGRHKHKARIPAYDYYPLYDGKIPLGCAVQLANFTRKKGVFTLDAFWNMGIHTLKLNYIFWASVEWKKFTHSFSRDIAPYVKKKNGKINTQCPDKITPCCS